MRGEKKSYFGDIARTPILAIGVVVISAIAVFFQTPFIIPVFSASLFSIIIIEEKAFSSVKHIIFAHGVSFFLAMFAPPIFQGLGVDAISYGGILVIAVLVFVAAFIQTVTKLEHPPAIAAILVLFEIEKGDNLIWGTIPFELMISFAAALVVIVVVAAWMDRKKKVDY